MCRLKDRELRTQPRQPRTASPADLQPCALFCFRKDGRGHESSRVHLHGSASDPQSPCAVCVLILELSNRFCVHYRRQVSWSASFIGPFATLSDEPRDRTSKQVLIKVEPCFCLLFVGHELFRNGLSLWNKIESSRIIGSMQVGAGPTLPKSMTTASPDALQRTLNPCKSPR